jgi:hypothetical protein
VSLSGGEGMDNLSQSNGTIIPDGVAREEQRLELVHLDEIRREAFSASDSDRITIEGQTDGCGVGERGSEGQTIPS